MNRKILSLFVGILLVLAVSVPAAVATVEWEVLNTLKLDAPPLDVAIAPDGKSVFILTQDGNIHIYAVDGGFKDKIEVGKRIDHINLGPKGERLFAASRQDQTVRVIGLDFVKQIATAGSPYKGLKEAPVVIADFSDFE